MEKLNEIVIFLSHSSLIAKIAITALLIIVCVFFLILLWKPALIHNVYASHGDITNFSNLCKKIWPLMEENKRIFQTFGPNSSADGTDKTVRHDLSVWHIKKYDIVNNNKTIFKLINEKTSLIPEKYSTVFVKLKNHIEAFETHVNNENIDYRNHQFPTEIVAIIEENR